MLLLFATAYSVFTIAANFVFASSNVMVNETAMTPELREHVGAINGAGATVAAAVRAVGPALGGVIWSLVASSSVSGAQFVPWLVFVLLMAGSAAVYWGA